MQVDDRINTKKMSCPICVGNCSALRTFICPYCDFKCCKTCYKNWVLSESTTQAKCMSTDCGRIFSTMFLFETMPHNFRIEYTRKLSKQTLFLEKQRLPVLQGVVIAKMKADHITELQRKLRTVVGEIQTLSQHLSSSVSEDIVLSEINGNKEHVIPRKCAGLNCSGFLSSKMKCAVCRCYSCGDCGSLKLDGHICSENDLATQTLLKNDTKNCPGCRTPIYKINGCSQMFCVVCHVAFDWKTLRVETGRIHNPHYYEMQRKLAGPGVPIAREPGDEPPGDCCFEVNPQVGQNPFLILSHKLNDLIQMVKTPHRNNLLVRYYTYLKDIFVTTLSHISIYELDNFRREIRQNDASRRKFASQYLEKKIHSSGLLKTIDLDVFFKNYTEIRLNDYLAQHRNIDIDATQNLYDSLKFYISNDDKNESKKKRKKWR